MSTEAGLRRCGSCGHGGCVGAGRAGDARGGRSR